MNLKNIKPYLPSKQFQKILASLLVIGLVISGIFFLFSKKEEFSRTQKGLEVNEKTVYEIIDTDTDSDGVADWEENLWGTDKTKKFTFGETSDLDYIANKKQALNIEKEVENTNLTETELFAREFFTAYTALKGTEGVNERDIASFSNALGQKIANPSIINIYTNDQITTLADTDLVEQKAYYNKVKKTFESYKDSGIGDELAIISKGLLTLQNEGKTEKYTELILIGEAYQEFAKKTSIIPVPELFKEYHLNIINSSHNTGVSVINMSKVVEDPIVGLSALSSYQKYSDDLVEAVEKLEKFFE